MAQLNGGKTLAIALGILSKTLIDVVLLDVQMPVMDGPETIKHIRNSSEIWLDVPTICLTADCLGDARERYLKMGMDDFIAKPLIANELWAKISSSVVNSPLRYPQKAAS